ncbi:hypothetical protein D3C74_91410 [compost metagenome]
MKMTTETNHIKLRYLDALAARAVAENMVSDAVATKDEKAYETAIEYLLSLNDEYWAAWVALCDWAISVLPNDNRYKNMLFNERCYDIFDRFIFSISA